MLYGTTCELGQLVDGRLTLMTPNGVLQKVFFMKDKKREKKKKKICVTMVQSFWMMEFL